MKIKIRTPQKDRLLTQVQLKAKESGLSKITTQEIEAEIKAARKEKAEKKRKISNRGK